MTPMNNADYLIRLQHADELDSMKAAKKASGLTYEALAEKIGVNKVWLASAFEGQQYVPEEYCDKLAEALGIDKSATAFLAEHPYKGNTSSQKGIWKIPHLRNRLQLSLVLEKEKERQKFM